MTLRAHGERASAASTTGFIGTTLPRRQAPSCVITRRASQSTIRLCRASAAKPPNTTECTAPRRAQASMATMASGTMPM